MKSNNFVKTRIYDDKLQFYCDEIGGKFLPLTSATSKSLDVLDDLRNALAVAVVTSDR